MKKGLYEEVTAKIVACLDKGVVPWRQTWGNYGAGGMPRNAITNRAYSGANVVLLWIGAQEKGYSAPLWLTYKQALEAGGNVRKGEKATQIVYLGHIVKDDDKSGQARQVPFLKSYAIFNLAQCEGLEHLQSSAPKTINPSSRDDLADQFIQSTGANVRHGESRAYYATKGDYINLPMFEAFNGMEEYYSTAFHELTHWTGAEHRLNRNMGKRFGDDSYSAEELVAELGSAFLCAEFGFDNETLENSAAYIDHWRKFLMNNERAFMAAASAASKATEFMRELALRAEPVLIAAE